jgi:hypothetical protein
MNIKEYNVDCDASEGGYVIVRMENAPVKVGRAATIDGAVIAIELDCRGKWGARITIGIGLVSREVRT